MKNKLIKLYDSFRLLHEIKDNIKKNPQNRNIFIFDVPEHGNLGDHAIMIAENQILKENFSNINIHEIPQRLSGISTKLLRPVIKNNTILITGGGNMGTLWFHHEQLFRKIITNYPNNKIVFFPQTIYYENTEWGKNELEKTKEIYNNHKKLTLFAREVKSFNMMKENFKNSNIELVPDIVTYLNPKFIEVERTDVLLCLRSDKESVISNNLSNHIDSILKKWNLNAKRTDTVVPIHIPIKLREKFFYEKLDEFRQSKLVITDRLHGMIFAAITNTPCIALDNKSKKVKGVYEWIENNKYIQVIDRFEEIDEKIKYVLNMENEIYNNVDLKPYFNKIIDMIK